MALFRKKKSAESRKKKPLWKRVLKWSGISFLLLLLLVILLPIIFKGKIIRMVKEEINNQVNAKVDFDEDNVELSFITTFPVLTLTLHDLTVDGVEQFENVRLVDIGGLTASLDLESVIFGSQIEIKRIALEDPTIHILVLEDGSANYDIAKEDTTAEETPEEESNFKLALQAYSITNGNLTYDDRSAVTFIEMNNFDHSGSGDITSDVFKLQTNTQAEKLTFGYDRVNYLNQVNTEMIADFDIDMSNDMKISFHDNSLRLNNLNLTYDGEFLMADEFYDMQFSFGAAKAGFKEFLSLVPELYATDMAAMTINGELEFEGSLDGRYSDESMPAFDVRFNVTNGYVKYSDLPDALSNIQIASRISREEGLDFDNTVIDVKQLHMDMGGNTLDAMLNVVNPITDPALRGLLKANVDLGSVGKFYPLGNDELRGKLKANIEMAGHVSDIEQERYEKFTAQGDLRASGIRYLASGEEVNVDSLVFLFSPQKLDLAQLKARAKGTNLQAKGSIQNYIAYFFSDELLSGTFDVHATRLNADDFLAADEVSDKDASLISEASETGSGEGQEESVSMEAIDVPRNIDFRLSTRIDNLIYNAVEMKDVNGLVHVKDGVALLEGLQLKAFGGSVGMSGSYDSRTTGQPKVDFAYRINEVNIQELAAGFNTVEKLAPIASKCTGKISSNFTLTGNLGADMMPVYSSLTGDGNLSSGSVYIEGFEPLNQLAASLKIDRLAKQTINDVKVFFQFADGKVNVKPYTVRIAKIPATISGYTAFDETIDYDMDLRIPKSEIPASMLEAAEKALGQAASVGLDFGELPQEIPVHADIAGTLRDPKINTNFKEQILALTANLTDALKNKVKEELEEKVEEVKEKVEEKIEDVKEDISAKVVQIMADAQAKANQIKAEGKKLAERTRQEGENQAQALIDAARNPLEKQAAKVTANKIKEEANKKADQIEAESQKRADAGMAEARKKVEKLENKPQ